jgi:hypothetical protein
VENGLGQPLIKYTCSRDKLNLENIHYPTVLSNPAVEIEMLFANTRREGILEILQKGRHVVRTDIVHFQRAFGAGLKAAPSRSEFTVLSARAWLDFSHKSNASA